MENFVFIFACLAIGKALCQLESFPRSTPKTLNALIIWVSLPALILAQIPALLKSTPLSASLLIPISMAWILFIIACVFFAALGKYLGWNRSQIGALTLTAGLGNTSFVGFPLLKALHGEEGMRVGILVDPGTFLALSVLGLIVAAYYSGHGPGEGSLVKSLKKVLSFPPVLALIVAPFWYYSGHYQPGILTQILDQFSHLLIPLALISVGFQLKFSPAIFRRQWKFLTMGLGFKMLLAPLLFVALYQGILGSHDFTTHITILEATMAPMVTATIVAEDFGLDAEIATLMLGIGICLSLVTVPLWDLALGH